MSLSSVSSEATEWVIKIQTSGSVDELWPAFEAWLYGDQAHWNAFVQAQDAWQRLDWLKNPRVRQNPAFVKRFRSPSRGGFLRSRAGFLWMTLGLSAVMLLVALI